MIPFVVSNSGNRCEGDPVTLTAVLWYFFAVLICILLACAWRIFRIAKRELLKGRKVNSTKLWNDFLNDDVDIEFFGFAIFTTLGAFLWPMSIVALTLFFLIKAILKFCLPRSVNFLNRFCKVENQQSHEKSK